ncbi:MAG: cysteine desulfurase [Anaerolineae bacterium SM23_ 63]|nr:MAG: cysteine desulfurase [Anaerolineae bacterium SM23_ 63]
MHIDPDLAVLDIEHVRGQFPILSREIKPGVPLIYLDSAATSQKPRQVIEAMSTYYERHNANVHRGIHLLAEEATTSFESSREKVAEFIGAESARQVIFTRNTTEAINLVAYSWARANLDTGDLIVLTEMEHHSNMVPWQILAEERGVRLAFITVTEDGLLDLSSFHDLLEEKPRLVAFTHMSNMLGTINPVKEMTRLAQDSGSVVLIDGAQAVPHLPVNVLDIGADFYAFSAHKMCGPTGIGVLYGREDLLEEMPPFLGGGDMIKRVQLESFTTNDLPYKFEAGTPPIAEGIGLGAAIDFLTSIGMQAVHQHEKLLIGRMLDRLNEVPGVKVYGPSVNHKGGVASFSFEGIHPHDVAQILDSQGIAVRAGHHCAMPIHEKFGLPATTRASFYLYNTVEEVDSLIEGLYKVKEIFN